MRPRCAVSASAAPERPLSFRGYDQEAAGALLRRGVARLHQLDGQPLNKGPLLGIPLWVQPRPLGELRYHRLLAPSSAGAAARELAESPKETLARFFEPLGDSLAKSFISSSCRLVPGELRLHGASFYRCQKALLVELEGLRVYSE
jgi:hypothetical protein